MKMPFFEYGDYIGALFPSHKQVKTLTFQVTEACSLCCTYCYQINKTPQRMTFETAKKAIDYLFDNRKNSDFYFCEETTQGIVIDFIGGEPLLEIDLITQIIDYFEIKFLECYEDCTWSLFHKYNFSTNGVAYFNPKVQKLLHKYGSLISMSVTLDGCKELHDKCRLFPDGSGSYDLASQAAIDQLNNYGNNSTKITISPDNVNYLFAGFKNMLDLGFSTIFANCVYEKGWELKHAQCLYQELIKISNYLVNNNLQDSIYFTLLDPEKYIDNNTNNQNWCGSTSCMLAIDYKGDIYPCIRFMASSLGPNVEPYKIGNLDQGIGYDELTKNRLNDLAQITRKSQSTEECMQCPIKAGCSWCTGYNYQEFGTINKRAIYICQMHKAAALASKYFYKLCKERDNYNKIQVNQDIALEIISLEEWNKIKNFQ